MCKQAEGLYVRHALEKWQRSGTRTISAKQPLFRLISRVHDAFSQGSMTCGLDL